MNRVDPMELIMMIKNGQNPQQLMLQVLSQRFNGNPMAQGLLQLAQQGKTQDIENIARNIMNEKGLDFDTEFAKFKKQYKL